jgi:predicted metal-dependent hydrolase
MHIRRLKVDFTKPVDREWVKGDPFMTHLLNALSTMFPAGEDFFKRSVKAVTGPTDDENVRTFMAQEALHSKVHADFNANLAAQGYPTEVMELFVERALELARKRLSPKANLSLTCALEHITALLAEVILTSPEILLVRIEDVRLGDMWMWHAVEELEHKAVAFDVYQEKFGDYRARALGLLAATLGLTVLTVVYQTALLREDRRNTPLVWAKGLTKLLVSPGYISRVLPAWARYLRKDFHPNQHDIKGLIEAYDVF